MAAQAYDSQFLESVSVRRRRMRDALLYGPQRGRRSAGEGLGKAFAGIAVTAVLCAGCVGWSFVADKMGEKGTSGPGVRPVPTAVMEAGR